MRKGFRAAMVQGHSQRTWGDTHKYLILSHPG